MALTTTTIQCTEMTSLLLLPSHSSPRHQIVVSPKHGYDPLTQFLPPRRLSEIHVEKFEHKHGVAIRKNPKAVMKLWKAVDRFNAILSANTEASARVESLLNNIDFSMKVMRQVFEL
ncbi:hypothetical protein EDB83DRAFT_2652282 [Lactarius deliciosus]|nr:hypothetical protein EDB83DRAFT_2652282 [Lactarius deliciosus]